MVHEQACASLSPTWPDDMFRADASLMSPSMWPDSRSSGEVQTARGGGGGGGKVEHEGGNRREAAAEGATSTGAGDGRRRASGASPGSGVLNPGDVNAAVQAAYKGVQYDRERDRWQIVVWDGECAGTRGQAEEKNTRVCSTRGRAFTGDELGQTRRRKGRMKHQEADMNHREADKGRMNHQEAGKAPKPVHTGGEPAGRLGHAYTACLWGHVWDALGRIIAFILSVDTHRILHIP